MKKILITCLILNGLLIVIMNFTNANNVYASFLGDAISQANSFIIKGSSQASSASNVTTSVTDNIVGIGQILTFIGIGVLVCVTSYMGIQFLISPPEKQGEIKEKLVGLAMATIVIFGAWGIWKIAINIFSKFD